jgi:hypothetical protein
MAEIKQLYNISTSGNVVSIRSDNMNNSDDMLAIAFENFVSFETKKNCNMSIVCGRDPTETAFIIESKSGQPWYEEGKTTTFGFCEKTFYLGLSIPDKIGGIGDDLSNRIKKNTARMIDDIILLMENSIRNDANIDLRLVRINLSVTTLFAPLKDFDTNLVIGDLMESLVDRFSKSHYINGKPISVCLALCNFIDQLKVDVAELFGFLPDRLTSFAFQEAGHFRRFQDLAENHKNFSEEGVDPQSVQENYLEFVDYFNMICKNFSRR